MARNKIALQYFPIDVEIFGDYKIKRLIRRYPRGLEFYMRLLTIIYGDKGYYLDVDDETYFDLADDLRMDESVIGEMICFCTSENVRLFDFEMFEKHRILTSRGIQNTYIDTMSKLKRQVDIRAEYSLLDLKCLGKLRKNGLIIQKNSEECALSSKKFGEIQNNSEKFGEIQKNEPFLRRNSEECLDYSEECADYSEKTADSSDKKKEKEKKEKEIKNNSLSLTLSPSSRAEREEAAAWPPQREREDFLKILLFEKNIIDPQTELDRFLAHYEKTGWLDANGNRVRNRLAALKAWTPAKDAPRCPDHAAVFWREVYEAVKTADPSADCSCLLAEFRGIVTSEQAVAIVCAAHSLVTFLELPQHIKAARSVIDRHFPGRRLHYRVPQTEKQSQ